MISPHTIEVLMAGKHLPYVALECMGMWGRRGFPRYQISSGKTPQPWNAKYPVELSATEIEVPSSFKYILPEVNLWR